MFKSIMESIAYEYRFYLERMQSLYPQLRTKELLTSAGGARIPEFSQVKADVLQIPVIPLQQKDTSHKSAAILVGYGVGIYSDLSETAINISEKTRMEALMPAPAAAEHYRSGYRIYQQIVEHMTKLHQQISL